jgi:hypothetical protein
MAGEYGHLSGELSRLASGQDFLVLAGSSNHDRTFEDDKERNPGTRRLIEYFIATHGTQLSYGSNPVDVCFAQCRIVFHVAF